jgi:hypothetical protein
MELALAVIPIVQLAWVVMRLEQVARRVREVESRVEALEVTCRVR